MRKEPKVLASTVGSELPQIQHLRAALEARRAAAFLTLDPDHQTWLAQFRALIYSRPIALLVDSRRTTLIVPELEERHANRHAAVDRVLAYAERPVAGKPSSATELIDEALAALGAGASVAVDEQRLPYSMVEQIRAAGCEVLLFSDTVRDLQEVKSPQQIAGIRRAGGLAAVGVEASLGACKAGVSELEVDNAGAAAILAKASMMGPETTVELLSMTPSGAERSILPHVFSSTRRIELGDVLIHTRQVALNGHRAELERTALVGSPTGAQREAFEVMLAAQRAAVEALSPGTRAAAVDAAARAVIDAAGYGEYFIHRTGHGIAVSVHEHPHVRFDNDQELKPGMVLTVEPGFYVPGLGGFRHSDTWAITDDGAEPLTAFPSSLAELTLGN